MELFLEKKQSNEVRYFIFNNSNLKIFKIYSIYKQILYKKREIFVTTFRKVRLNNYFKKNRRGI